MAETASRNGKQNCPHRRKFIIVLHNGDPVYECAEGNDLALSHTHICLERAGITVIGIYPGDDANLEVKLKLFFPIYLSVPATTYQTNSAISEEVDLIN